MYQHVFDENRQTDMRNCFLNELAPLGMLRHYSKRDEINQSFIGQAVAIVVDGKVCKSILSSTGQQRLLYTLRPGEMIGEMSLMCGGNLGYQLRAKEDSDISFVGMDALNKALEAKPSIYRHLLNSVTRKNRILLLQLTGATFNNAYGSIADALLRLAACSDTMDSKWAPDTISTSFTQAELAHNTGCSRVTVTRVLNRFVEEKIISVRDRRIVIHDIAALTAYTDTV